jgi:replication fork protection complex subunit Csm3/Swi3
MLLRTYQLWLDDLYPRAKFADGLAIIEKLGHSKYMQMLRKQWIDEDKPKPEGFEDMEPALEEAEPHTGKEQANRPSPTEPTPTENRVEEDSLFEENSSSRTTRPSRSNEPEEDELDALLAEVPLQQSNGHNSPSYPAEQDELDALLDEGHMETSNNANSNFGAAALKGHSEKRSNDFEDDEEALRELEMV